MGTGIPFIAIYIYTFYLNAKSSFEVICRTRYRGLYVSPFGKPNYSWFCTELRSLWIVWYTILDRYCLFVACFNSSALVWLKKLRYVYAWVHYIIRVCTIIYSICLYQWMTAVDSLKLSLNLHWVSFSSIMSPNNIYFNM